MTRTHIGSVSLWNSGTWHAACARCEWKLNKRDKADAVSLLQSHYRIAHPVTIPVYLEES